MSREVDTDTQTVTDRQTHTHTHAQTKTHLTLCRLLRRFWFRSSSCLRFSSFSSRLASSDDRLSMRLCNQTQRHTHTHTYTHIHTHAHTHTHTDDQCGGTTKRWSTNATKASTPASPFLPSPPLSSVSRLCSTYSMVVLICCLTLSIALRTPCSTSAMSSPLARALLRSSYKTSVTRTQPCTEGADVH